MKQQNRELGRLGEGLATQYLMDKGYQIKERNFSTRFGELDLICMDKDVWVFVEVKTKKGQGFGRPEEMVGRGKLRRVRNMATIYLHGREVPCRIDMVAVVLQDNGAVEEIRHYRNVS